MKEMTLKASIIAYVGTLVLILTAGSVVQYFFGIIGVAVTELMILGWSLAVLKASGVSFRTVFPFELPKLRQMFGALAIYFGAYMSAASVSIATTTVFPSSAKIEAAMISVLTERGEITAFIAAAVLPSFCEELLHRGILLSGVRNYIHKRMTAKGRYNPVGERHVIVFILGAAFGLFHLDPIRFLPTAILGAGLSYIALRIGSLFMPVCLHFLNNAVSVVSAFMAQTARVQEDAAAVIAGIEYPVYAYIGMATMYIGLALPSLWVGSRLFAGSGERANRGRMLAVMTAALILVLGGGFAAAYGIYGAAHAAGLTGL